MQENENHEGQEKGDLKVYEVGYLIVPSVAESGLPELVSNLKGIVEGLGGLFISEDFPRLRPLAYQMVLSEDGKTQKFNQAYFGWFKFEVETDKIKEIESVFKSNQNIIRFLLIETVKENTLYSHKLIAKKTRDRAVKKVEEEGVTAETPSAEIDKSIEELVIN